MDAAERKHKPTPHFRRKVREQGRYARSDDLGSALVLLVATAVLWSTGPRLFARLQVMIDSSMTVRGLPARGDLVGYLQSNLAEMLFMLLPMLALVCLITVGYQWFQAGFQLFPGKLGLKWERINPWQGLQGWFGTAGVSRLGFGLLKICTISLLVGTHLWSSGEDLLFLPRQSIVVVAQWLGQTLLVCTLKIACALVALGVLEYAFQRWQFERSMLMTDEELREELKEDAANPLISNRRRQLRQELSNRDATG